MAAPGARLNRTEECLRRPWQQCYEGELRPRRPAWGAGCIVCSSKRLGYKFDESKMPVLCLYFVVLLFPAPLWAAFFLLETENGARLPSR